MTFSAEYNKLNDAYRAAYWKFDEAQKAYHSLKIDDAEFFAVKAEFDAALAAVEVAFETEVERAEAETETTEPATTNDDNAQMVLL